MPPNAASPSPYPVIRTAPWWRWFGENPLLAGALLLTLMYLYAYLAYPALPGNRTDYPLGWWGWFDQSQVLKSTLALARRDLSPDQHWYPLGYALLGAPFAGWLRLRMHPFFFVDLAALLTAYAACAAFIRRCGLGPWWAAAIFVLPFLTDRVLLAEWVVPWNTTPTAALLWLLLAVTAAHIAGKRRPMLLGLLAVSIPIMRPTELLLVLPSLAGALLVDLRHRRLSLRDIVRFAIGAGVPAMLFAALYLRIYGAHPSDYMRQSGQMGFTLHGLAWKAYVILVDPRAWIGGGQGLIARCPYLIFGIAGLLPALRRPATAVLAVTLMLHSVLYLSYVDLMPTAFWRYLNVHYWTWSFPGFALLGVLLLRDLLTPASRRLAGAALAVVLVLLCVRIVPVPADAGERVDALDFPVGKLTFDSVNFAGFRLTDAAGTLENINQMRAIALPDRTRIVALTRPLHPPVSVTMPELHDTTPVPLRMAYRFGLPSWLWARADEFYGPRL